ncbi:MAG TPA: hypothetical protein VF483_02105 [Gemmatimonadaceae bacterium]
MLTLASNGEVFVTFSEGILTTTEQAATALRLATSDAKACSLISTDFSIPVMRIGFQCSLTAWSTKRVHFELHPGLKSMNGLPVGYIRSQAVSSQALSNSENLVLDIDLSSSVEINNARIWTLEASDS